MSSDPNYLNYNFSILFTNLFQTNLSRDSARFLGLKTFFAMIVTVLGGSQNWTENCHSLKQAYIFGRFSAIETKSSWQNLQFFFDNFLECFSEKNLSFSQVP